MNEYERTKRFGAKRAVEAMHEKGQMTARMEASLKGKTFRLGVLLLSQLALGAFAATSGTTNAVNRLDPDFVKVSLLVIGSGDELFGCVGHCALRMECPTFGLDNCFTCESDSLDGNCFKLFMGKMSMGMFAVPTETFLRTYEENGRTASQHELRLRPDVKQRLWKIMDDRVRQGSNLPYDYIKYSCAQSLLFPILEAIRPYPIAFPDWLKSYSLTRRETLVEDLRWAPWTSVFLHTIAGIEVDREVRPLERIILPVDLLKLFKETTVLGEPLVVGTGEVLLSQRGEMTPCYVRPMTVSCLFLSLALLNFLLKRKELDWFFLLVQSLLGVLEMHLVFVSTLPATDWNWLLVPFNLFPLLFWRWRRHWALPFAGVLVFWIAFMLISPHQLTDTAYPVFVLAYVAVYLRIGLNCAKLLSVKSAENRPVQVRHGKCLCEM